MQKKLISLLLVALFLIISVLAGCSSEKTTTAQETTTAAQETTKGVQETQEAETTEAATVAEDEILFDSYTIPTDWPRAVPLHNEMKVTKYERTESSMIASGYCKYAISGINNYYTNAQKEVGGGYPWEFDSNKESVTQGADQVFYFISEEGQSLTIKFTEVEKDVLTFELDYKE